jgi:ankyrin repeat protein
MRRHVAGAAGSAQDLYKLFWRKISFSVWRYTPACSLLLLILTILFSPHEKPKEAAAMLAAAPDAIVLGGLGECAGVQINGAYTLQPGLINGRVHWVSSRSTYQRGKEILPHIYWSDSHGAHQPHWYVDHDLDDAVSYAYVPSAATVPAAAGWQEYCDGAWAVRTVTVEEQLTAASCGALAAATLALVACAAAAEAGSGCPAECAGAWLGGVARCAAQAEAFGAAGPAGLTVACEATTAAVLATPPPAIELGGFCSERFNGVYVMQPNLLNGKAHWAQCSGLGCTAGASLAHVAALTALGAPPPGPPAGPGKLYWGKSKGQWCVDNDLDDAGYHAFVDSAAAMPPAAGWEEYCDGAWAARAATVQLGPALNHAADRGQLEAVRLLLEAGADPSDSFKFGFYGLTPLMRAAAKGHLEVLRLLLVWGAAVDAAHPDDGCTAFHLACRNNQIECAEALVRAGCDISIINSASASLMGGDTGRMIAEAQGIYGAAMVERLDALDTERQSWVAQASVEKLVDTATETAATEGYLPDVQEGIDASTKAELKKKKRKLVSKLIMAAKNGDAAAVAQLLAAGVDPNAKGGPKPKHVGDPNTFGDLLTSVYSLTGGMGPTTPLVEAAALGQLEVVRLLLDGGADPSRANGAGCTPLMAAVVYGRLTAASGQLGVLRLLLARGAVVDAVDLDGNSAFHWACDTNQPDCVAVLVRAGCDVGITNKDGETGQMMAKAKGYAVTASWLEVLDAGQLREAQASTPPRSALPVPSGGGAEAMPETENEENNQAAYGMAAQDVAHSASNSHGGSAFAAGPATKEVASVQDTGNGSQASPPAAFKKLAEVQTSPADVPVLSDVKARPNAEAMAEQEADGAAQARAEEQVESAHDTVGFVQQPSSGTWYSVAVWSWKAEIAVVVLVCFILVSRQRAAGRVETGSGTQREREAEASLATARRQAEAQAAERIARAEAALQQAKDQAEAMAARRPESPACPVCFENYHASKVVPRILACGHTICEHCLQMMLATIVANGNTKAIDCPKCRKETHVPRGRATELLINFDLL